jgi:hypothetical protein
LYDTRRGYRAAPRRWAAVADATTSRKSSTPRRSSSRWSCSACPAGRHGAPHRVRLRGDRLSPIAHRNGSRSHESWSGCPRPWYCFARRLRNSSKSHESHVHGAVNACYPGRSGSTLDRRLLRWLRSDLT